MSKEYVKLKKIKISLAILVTIVGILNITGMWNNIPIIFLLVALINIFNGRESYKDNRKIEAVMLFMATIFTCGVAIYMLFF
jgi:predicted membrane protein